MHDTLRLALAPTVRGSCSKVRSVGISGLHFACDRHCKCTSFDLYVLRLPASAPASVQVASAAVCMLMIQAVCCQLLAEWYVSVISGCECELVCCIL